MAYPLMTRLSLRLLGVAYYLFTGTPAACSDTHRSTDTPLAGMTRQPHPIHCRAASHRVSSVAAREFATDEDDFAEVFLVVWAGSPGTGAGTRHDGHVCEGQR
jgi:hypothetical protein